MILVTATAYGSAHLYWEHKFDRALTEAATIDPTSWDKPYENNEIKDSYKVAYVTYGSGEYSAAKYFQYEAEKLGWQVKVYYNNAWEHESEVLAFDPDFILFAVHSDPHISIEMKAHRSKKYLINFESLKGMRNSFGLLSKTDPYQPLGKLKTFLENVHGVFSGVKEVSMYKEMFNKLNKPFNGLRLLPSIPEIEGAPAQLQNLMWVSCAWGGYRASGNYKEFIRLLSDNVPMKVYGSYINSAYLKPGVYDGIISPGIDNVNTIKQNGIYLLTHSDGHFSGGEISMRGFEAAAASAVVISDKLPFIVENFGDSFLYFDHTLDAQRMYAQVKAHMDWIEQNPEAARAMAAKANKIYREKFTLRKDLLRMAKMHEGVLAQEKAMALSHPLAY